MPWRRAGRSKWRVITDLRCPLGSILSANPSKRSTVGETDPITDVSHGAYSCSARTSIHARANEGCIHVHNCALCLHDCKAEGERKAAVRIHFRAFQVSSSPCWAERRRTERQVGHAKGFRVTVNSPFPCIHLVRSCTKARFEKPGKMQSVPLPLHFLCPPIPKHKHIVMNFSNPGWSEQRNEREMFMQYDNT